jgi:hypothetical protein
MNKDKLFTYKFTFFTLLQTKGTILKDVEVELKGRHEKKLWY